ACRGRMPRSGGGGRRFPCPLSLRRSLEQLAKAREAAEHPALDRTDGLAESFGELGLREASVVRELQCLALLVGKPTQRALHPLALITKPSLFVDRTVARLFARRLEWFPAPSLFAPHEIDRASMNEREEPRPGSRAFRHEL